MEDRKSNTLRHALNSALQIAASFLQSKDNVLVRPIWEHFFDGA